MGLRVLVDTLRRRWRWVAVATVAGLLAALAVTAASAPTYRSTASVFFSLQYGNSASDLVQGSTYAQNQVVSFATLATTPAVLQPVIDELDLAMSPAQLAGQVTAQAPLDTVLVDVVVTDGSAERSARLANAVAESLAETVESLAPTNAEDQPTVEATLVAPAAVPGSAASPNVPLDLVGGTLLGLLVGLGLAFLRQVLDNRVVDAASVAAVTLLPVLGTIARVPAAGRSPIVVESDPQSPPAEFYRQLRTNLQFLELPLDGGERGRLRVIALTSALMSEGKTTVAANLAAAVAQTGSRVLLVDADLRRPSVARALDLEGAVGLTNVLLGSAALEDVVQEWGFGGLEVLAAGALPPNPAELLSSPAMTRLLDSARETYDLVVVDTAPVLPVADAAILSQVVDGVLVVANVTRVRRPQLAEALGDLDQVGGRVLGVVLNEVARELSAYTYQQDRPARPVLEAAAAPLPASGHVDPAGPALPGPAGDPQGDRRLVPAATTARSGGLTAVEVAGRRPGMGMDPRQRKQTW